MTSHLSSWLVKRNPWILLITLAALWLAQMGSWALWEWQRQPTPTTDLPQESETPPPILSAEASGLNATPQENPDCPFSSRNPEVLSRYFEYANLSTGVVDAPAAPPESPSLTPEPPPDAPPADLSSPVVTETNGVSFAQSLRYRGFIQTPHQVQIAFVEDLDAVSTHRLRLGDKLKEWTLQAMARQHVVFESAQKESVTIFRHTPQPAAESVETIQDPSPIVIPAEAVPPSDTNSPAILDSNPQEEASQAPVTETNSPALAPTPDSNPIKEGSQP